MRRRPVELQVQLMEQFLTGMLVFKLIRQSKKQPEWMISEQTQFKPDA